MAEIGNKENNVWVEGFKVKPFPFGVCVLVVDIIVHTTIHHPLGVWCVVY